MTNEFKEKVTRRYEMDELGIDEKFKDMFDVITLEELAKYVAGEENWEEWIKDLGEENLKHIKCGLKGKAPYENALQRECLDGPLVFDDGSLRILYGEMFGDYFIDVEDDIWELFYGEKDEEDYEWEFIKSII